VKEPLGGAHRNKEETAAALREGLERNLARLLEVDERSLLEHRYERFRRLGQFQEPDPGSNGKK